MIITFQARRSDVVPISISHLSVSVSLNILLTFMIVVRLVLHGRNVRAATGSRAGISGLYKTLSTMLIESSALYTVTSSMLIGMWATGSVWAGIILPVQAQIQVCAFLQLDYPDRLPNVMIAPLLIIQRVANRSALTSDTIVSGRTDSFHVRSRGVSTGGSCALPGGYTTYSADERGGDADDHMAVVETRIVPQLGGRT